VWTIAAFFVALASVAAICAYLYAREWTPLQKHYRGLQEGISHQENAEKEMVCFSARKINRLTASAQKFPQRNHVAATRAAPAR